MVSEEGVQDVQKLDLVWEDLPDDEDGSKVAKADFGLFEVLAGSFTALGLGSIRMVLKESAVGPIVVLQQSVGIMMPIEAVKEAAEVGLASIPQEELDAIPQKIQDAIDSGELKAPEPAAEEPAAEAAG